MRRNIGNELIVALFAAVSLLFALLFAVLLASSTQNPPAATQATAAGVTARGDSLSPTGVQARATSATESAAVTEATQIPSPTAVSTSTSSAIPPSPTRVATASDTEPGPEPVDAQTVLPPQDDIRRQLTQIALTVQSLIRAMTAVTATSTAIPPTLHPGQTDDQPTELAPVSRISFTATALASTIEALSLSLTAVPTATRPVLISLEPSPSPTQPMTPALGASATTATETEVKSAVDWLGLTLTQLAQSAETRGLALTAAAAISTETTATREPSPTLFEATELMPALIATTPYNGISITLTQLAQTAEALSLALTAEAGKPTEIPPPTESPAAHIEATEITPAVIATTPPDSATETPDDDISVTPTQLAQTVEARGITLTDAAVTTETTAATEPSPTLIEATESMPTLIATTPLDAISVTLTQLAQTAEALSLALTAETGKPTEIPPPTGSPAAHIEATEVTPVAIASMPPDDDISVTPTQLAQTAEARGITVTAAAPVMTDATTATESSPTLIEATKLMPALIATTPDDAISVTLTQLAQTAEALSLALTAETGKPTEIPPPTGSPAAHIEATEVTPVAIASMPPDDDISVTPTQLAQTAEARGITLTAAADVMTDATNATEPSPTFIEATEDMPAVIATTPDDAISVTLTQLAQTVEARGITVTAAAAVMTDATNATEPSPTLVEATELMPVAIVTTPPDSETESPDDDIRASLTQLAQTAEARGITVTAAAAVMTDATTATEPSPTLIEATKLMPALIATTSPDSETEPPDDGINVTLTQLARTAEARGITLTDAAVTTETTAATEPSPTLFEATELMPVAIVTAPRDSETESRDVGISVTLTQLARTADALSLALTIEAEKPTEIPPTTVSPAAHIEATEITPAVIATTPPDRETEPPDDGINVTLTYLARTADARGITVTDAADVMTDAATATEPSPTLIEATKLMPALIATTPDDAISVTLTQLARTAEARGIALTAAAAVTTDAATATEPSSTLIEATELMPALIATTPDDAISVTLTQLARTAEARGIALTAAAAVTTDAATATEPSSTLIEATKLIPALIATTPPVSETELPDDDISVTPTQLAQTVEARGITLKDAAVTTETTAATEPSPTPAVPTEITAVATATATLQRQTEAAETSIGLTLTQLAQTADALSLALTIEAEKPTEIPPPTVSPAAQIEATEITTVAIATAPPDSATETPDDDISVTPTQLAQTADARGIMLTAAADVMTDATNATEPSSILIEATKLMPALIATTPDDAISVTLTQLAQTAEARGITLTAAAAVMTDATTATEPSPTLIEVTKLMPALIATTPDDAISVTLTQLARTAEALSLALTIEAGKLTEIPPTTVSPAAHIEATELMPALIATTPDDAISVTLTQLAQTVEARGITLTDAAVTTETTAATEPSPTLIEATELMPALIATAPDDAISVTLTQLAQTADARGIALTAAAAVMTDATIATEPSPTLVEATEDMPVIIATAPDDAISVTLTQLAQTADARGIALTAAADVMTDATIATEPSPTLVEATKLMPSLIATTPDDAISVTLTQLARTADARGIALTDAAVTTETTAATEPSPTLIEATELMPVAIVTAPRDSETESRDVGISVTLTQLAQTAEALSLALTIEAGKLTEIPPPTVSPAAHIEATELMPALIATTSPVSATEPPDDAISVTLTQLAQTADARGITLTATAGIAPVTIHPPAGQTANSPTPVASPSPTPLPNVSAHLIATPTAFGALDENMQDSCKKRQDWLPYQVKAGDTLVAVAQAVGSSLIELRMSNCYKPARGIFTDDILLVPRLPRDPISTLAPVFPAGDAAMPVAGCASELARIDSPAAMAALYGVFELRGSASAPPAGSYRIDLRADRSDTYFPFLSSAISVRRGVLGLINTEIFGYGLHWLRLSVMDEDGATIDNGICELPLLFSRPNSPPAHPSD